MNRFWHAHNTERVSRSLAVIVKLRREDNLKIASSEWDDEYT